MSGSSLVVRTSFELPKTDLSVSMLSPVCVVVALTIFQGESTLNVRRRILVWIDLISVSLSVARRSKLLETFNKTWDNPTSVLIKWLKLRTEFQFPHFYSSTFKNITHSLIPVAPLFFSLPSALLIMYVRMTHNFISDTLSVNQKSHCRYESGKLLFIPYRSTHLPHDVSFFFESSLEVVLQHLLWVWWYYRCSYFICYSRLIIFAWRTNFFWRSVWKVQLTIAEQNAFGFFQFLVKMVLGLS